MLGLRRGAAVMAAGGLLATATACDPAPAPSDEIQVTYLTLPGDPAIRPTSAMVNDHGQIVVSGVGPGATIAYTWSEGEWAPFGEQTFPSPSDVSNEGHVVGTFRDEDSLVSPFLLADGDLTRLPTGDTSGGGAYAVNDQGVVAGQVGGYTGDIRGRRNPHHLLSYSGRAAVWYEGELLTPPLEDDELASSAALHVNNRNQVLIASGIGGDPTDTPQWALWEIGDEDVTYLHNPYELQGFGTLMATLNDQGMVFGSAVVLFGLPDVPNAFPLWSISYRWHEGRRTELGSLGGSWTSVTAANAWGQAVGLTTGPEDNIPLSSFDRHPFLWDQGQMTPLEMPEDAGVSDFEPTDINNWGQVVGMGTGADGVRRPFLWQNGRVADLGEIAGVQERVGYWTPEINDRGQIVYVTDNRSNAGPNVVLWEVSPLWGYPEGL